jgi:putative transposase
LARLGQLNNWGQIQFPDGPPSPTDRPRLPHHIIQRGNNRQAIFGGDADYELLLDLLDEHARKQQVAIHGYVLMSNHFHLLATPETEEGIPQMMQAVGRRYVRNYNLRHQRTGTLWEGRYRSTLIQAERYLLACMVYMDLNPVRAGHGGRSGRLSLVEPPALHRPRRTSWSRRIPVLGMGNTPFRPRQAYTTWSRAGIARTAARAHRLGTLRGWAVGEPDYVAELQRRRHGASVAKPGGRPSPVRFDLSPIK